MLRLLPQRRRNAMTYLGDYTSLFYGNLFSAYLYNACGLCHTNCVYRAQRARGETVSVRAICALSVEFHVQRLGYSLGPSFFFCMVNKHDILIGLLLSRKSQQKLRFYRRITCCVVQFEPSLSLGAVGTAGLKCFACFLAWKGAST